MPRPIRASQRPVTTILIDAGAVTAGQVEAALLTQRRTGRRTGEILVEMGAVSEEDIGWALSHQLGLPFVDVRVESLDIELVRSFPEGLLHRLEAVPLVRAERSLSVAFSDPTDGDAIDALERAAECPVDPAAATRSAVHDALTAILGPAREHHPRIEAPDATPPSAVLWDRSGTEFLLFHLTEAQRSGASEIHFHPRPGEMHVSYRVNGTRIEVSSESLEVNYSLLSRLTALGGPAIDDRDLHVRGQVRVPQGKDELLLEVSLLNHDEGISVLLGLPQEPPRPLCLDDLGLRPLDVARVRETFEQPSGLVIVAGPPRSGCSTTLAALAALDSAGRRSIAFKIRSGGPLGAGMRITLPRERARASWAEIVRAQNPDVVVLDDVLVGDAVGELLAGVGSGRLVLASTDWTDGFALLDYLMAQPHLRPMLAARLHLVVQQRLVDFPESVPPTDATRDRGSARRAVFEVLHLTEPMRQLVRDGDPARRLRALAAADGLPFLADQIAELVTAGAIGPRQAARLLS